MPLLEIHDLKKSYRSPAGDVQSVLDIGHLALDEGEEMALEGRSGSGKTTLLHCIAGILRPDRGRIEVAGEDVCALSEAGRDRFRAEHIGYVFQTFNLLQGYTALENVVLGMMFGSGPDRARAEQLLVELGLKERLHHRPRQLSIGQQQRVAVARALANTPSVVLADEPTGNLDVEHASEALELLRKACATHGAALLLVSHDPLALDRFARRVSLAELNRATGGAAEVPR